MSKMKKCSVCQKDIAKSAKVCPDCGAKQKKPIWAKWWIWVLAVIVLIAVVSGSGDNSENASTTTEQAVEENITYEAFTVDQMVDDLSSNAMAAEMTYGDKYLEITGRLCVIDSDGKYISLEPANNEFSLTNVQCSIKNDEQKAHVATLSKGDVMTIRVKVTSVGEVLGYSADIVEFVQ